MSPKRVSAQLIGLHLLTSACGFISLPEARDVDSSRLQGCVNRLELQAEIERLFLAVASHSYAVVHRNQITRFKQRIDKPGFPLGLPDPMAVVQIAGTRETRRVRH
jgi:hypothetical protein